MMVKANSEKKTKPELRILGLWSWFCSAINRLRMWFWVDNFTALSLCSPSNKVGEQHSLCFFLLQDLMFAICCISHHLTHFSPPPPLLSLTLQRSRDAAFLYSGANITVSCELEVWRGHGLKSLKCCPSRRPWNNSSKCENSDCLNQETEISAWGWDYVSHKYQRRNGFHQIFDIFNAIPHR